MRRGLLPIVGSRIISAERPPCRLKPILLAPAIGTFRRRVQDRLIAGIGRRGKRILIELDDEQTIVIEPRMTGLMLLSDPPGTEHLRLKLGLSGTPHSQLLFWDRRGLGTVRLMHAAEVEAKINQRLGVDALEITPDELKVRLGRSTRAVKVALLDQSAVAGIGNLYASEILFLAGVDPRTRCERLTGPQWNRIHQQIGEVLREAIRHEGSTLSDGTYRNALNNPGGFQNHHRVYDRADRACVRCDQGVVQRIVQAQRSTFFCGQCQRKRGSHRSLAKPIAW